MSFWVRFLTLLDAQMTTPQAYGWFHLLCWAITVGAAVMLCLLYKRKPFSVRAVILVTAIAVMVAELYKQINFSVSYTDGIKFDYPWAYFPWQFCSIPMFAGLLAGITRRGRLHRALCAFLATYAVFAGLCVMIYPGDVFIETIGINIQTMLCHGSMITVGIFLFYTNYVEATPKTFLRALPIFAFAVSVAAILNEIAFRIGLLEEHTFNMFYISPHCDPHLPVYSSVQELIPFPFCLIVYIAVFSLAAFLILLIAMGIKKIAHSLQSKQKQALVP